MTEYHTESVRIPHVSEVERRQRLAQVYEFLLQFAKRRSADQNDLDSELQVEANTSINKEQTR